ncbi:MAG: hypothetical protein KJ674_05960 [Nanoarchaeota archaeon]|nr:hypothetical protein [Nanoarchaeota archaeon]
MRSLLKSEDLQKWFIIGAIWVIAIALLLGAFRGRYTLNSGGTFSGSHLIDNWTGRTYMFDDLYKKTEK